MSTDAEKFIEKVIGVRVSFGKALWSIRTGNEQTQKTFAKKLGVSKQYLSALENERSFVSISQAQKFAHKLGHSEKVFITYVLQDMLENSGAHYEVELKKAA